MTKLSLYLWLTGFLLIGCDRTHEEKPSFIDIPGRTYINEVNGKHTLIRNNKPYKVRGGVNEGNIADIVRLGGNSIRTYTYQQTIRAMNDARDAETSVSIGIWLDHVDKFDYSDQKLLDRKLLEIKSIVKSYRNHPALLMWCIGSEFQLNAHPDIDGWKFVNTVSKMIHQLDPNHPTSTALPGYPRTHMPFIKYFCDDLDLLCFNSFGGVNAIAGKLKNPIWGYDGPYILGELGNYGYWEPNLEKQHEMPVEHTDTEKAARFQELFNVLKHDTSQLLGYYVFYAGQKQEYTPTWFSILGPNGEHTAMSQQIQMEWSKETVANLAPKIEVFELKTEGSSVNRKIIPGSNCTLTYNVSDAENDSLTINLEILRESQLIKDKFGVERKPEKIETDFVISKNTVQFTAPDLSGPYRVYMYVYDERNQASVNVPFYID